MDTGPKHEKPLLVDVVDIGVLMADIGDPMVKFLKELCVKESSKKSVLVRELLAEQSDGEKHALILSVLPLLLQLLRLPLRLLERLLLPRLLLPPLLALVDVNWRDLRTECLRSTGDGEVRDSVAALEWNLPLLDDADGTSMDSFDFFCSGAGEGFCMAANTTGTRFSLFSEVARATTSSIIVIVVVVVSCSDLAL